MDIFVRPIEMSLRKAHIPYRLKSRTKTAYSIWKKMQAKQIPFEEVADIFAIRIIIDVPDASSEKEKELCWKVYSFVTEHYEPDTSRLRDWITVPKSNGYESLHTTVTAQNNQRIEVQIRTSRMDDVAENGYASHWLYKGVKNDASLNAWLTSVKNLLESPYKKPEAQFNLFSNDVFVFTPEGDLRKLPADSSVFDFAFDIHTNLGLKCSGAKINGKLCSIREKLKTGDVVEVITSKNQRPSSDWLNFVVSSKAKAKIRQKLNEELGKQIQAGKELFERRMSNWKIDVNDEVLNFLVKQCKFKSIGEFYSALAVGTLDIMDVKDILSSREEREESGVGEESSFQTQKNIQKSYDGSDILMIDDKLNNVGYKLAKCCNPIMGDEVFGFVTVRMELKSTG
jgi:GTP pyrophosphokinase